MIEIIIQNNKSEPNRITKDITTISTLSGLLRSDTSIIDPVFSIKADISDLTGCNYVTVESFGRSYFVKDIVTRSGGFVELSCHVDVLSSFKDEILANQAIIKRQENTWNLYLNDGSFKVYQNTDTVTIPFGSGFTTQSYILAVAG